MSLILMMCLCLGLSKLSLVFELILEINYLDYKRVKFSQGAAYVSDLVPNSIKFSK